VKETYRDADFQRGLLCPVFIRRELVVGNVPAGFPNHVLDVVAGRFQFGDEDGEFGGFLDGPAGFPGFAVWPPVTGRVFDAVAGVTHCHISIVSDRLPICIYACNPNSAAQCAYVRWWR